MHLRIPDPWMFSLYALPVFFFPLSTAATGISAGLLLVLYGVSGHWKNWASLRQRVWVLPLFLYMAWTFIGLIWTKDLHAGLKVAATASYGIYAIIGATLPWREKYFKIFVRLFLAGLAINGLLAALITWRVILWHYSPDLPYVGLSDHIWWSMALTHAILWLIFDLKKKWNFSRFINLPLLIIFSIELALSPGRSGQLLFLLLTPIAIFFIYSGIWRYWALFGTAAIVAVMLVSPYVQSRLELGVKNLQQFVSQPKSTDTSWGIRLATMWAGAELIVEHPFFGVGTGDFGTAMEKLQRQGVVTETPGIRSDSAANSYLSEGAVLGIPGLLLFLWFLINLSREKLKIWREPQGWLVVTYLGIFWIGGLYNTLNWGYADAMGLAFYAGLPLTYYKNTRASVINDEL
ncbi:MAG: O-antigen ligase family protein [Acidithiobacillus sp.]|nr:O-antigen ligase family protein [Acidithiobacillus sp.]